ncbi:MAG: nucleotidyltransferase domain-containing protein [Nanoarchaeota archaeon]|nr:nucleotidyltransferase domain-containing protein [Nanoarchaeota archaeon]
MDILQEALKRIKPSKAEEKKVNAIAVAIIKKINIPNTVPAIGGSFAKGTWLKGNHDIDIYVRFSKKQYSGKDISLILGQVLRKEFKKVDTLHGSRDYFQITHKPYTVEIVPIMDVEKADLAENITDVSPLHVVWVSHHKHLLDDMRLAKAFFKANRLYGAESYIQGFSGYVLEILTVYYSGFDALMQNIAKWDISKKVVIDIEGYHKGKPIIAELNKAKLFSPLILIDPVQKERNAAAGLGHEVFEKAIILARKFIEKPLLKFFEKEKVTKALLKKKAGKNALVLIEAKALDGKRDIVGAKLLKCFEFFKKLLAKHEFKLIESGWEWEKNALFWFIVPKERLSEKRKHFGPPMAENERLENFKLAWEGNKVLEEDGRAYVVVKRKHRDAKSLLKALLKDEYVKERVKGIRLL